MANGGTGRSSVTSGNLLLGAGTSAMTALAGGSVGEVVTWNGSAWGSAAGSGGALQTYDVAITPGTWTKPATIKGIKVTVVGGGGNGGSVGGAGGGGGGTAIRIYPAPSLPGPQPYTVGGASGTSSFGVAPITVISATGGAAGGSAPSNGANGGIGSNGQANIGGSGGGASAGGFGGSSSLGGGGAARTPVGGVGAAGRNYGGGGSGGSPGTTSTGNAGAAGVVIIEEFY